ncbi:MAG: exodeoxyribonuclease VII large subunit [Clostridia bacterium]|nr:exodeoxyribonuclease VII large subunit [Clostridia bacterium]
MKIVTVSQVNNYIKRKIDEDINLSSICIRGEISNFKHHYSGHMYMSLKDSTGAIKAVMFRGSAATLKFVPKDGMSILAVGRVGVYERDGVYQLYIDTMVPDGIGQLYAAYEQLKAELEEKGYFDSERKKPIPLYPKVVGVVTASTGAAVRDIINVISRRWPVCDIKIYPALVQGVGAAQSVAEGIRFFNDSSDADVLIVGRGGGSIEDLWAFNEKTVADAALCSRIPIISAVGHETDYTILDFVADLRAPTPSAAAELATPDIGELRNFFLASGARLGRALLSLAEMKRNQLRMCMSSHVMRRPMRMIEDRAQEIDDAVKRLLHSYTDCIEKRGLTLREYSYKLGALNPVNVLSRGYSVAKKGDKVIKNVCDVCIGDEITLTVTDGDINCTVK